VQLAIIELELQRGEKKCSAPTATAAANYRPTDEGTNHRQPNKFCRRNGSSNGSVPSIGHFKKLPFRDEIRNALSLFSTHFQCGSVNCHEFELLLKQLLN
jgi:hypothetical protein